MKSGSGTRPAVVVFTPDESRWDPHSRFLRGTVPDSNGKYMMTLAPYDNYLVIAVEGLEDGQWQDPEFLRAVKDLATRLSMAENETKTLDLSIVAWRR